MKLAHLNLEHPLDFSNAEIQTLILESPQFFLDFVFELKQQSEGQVGRFVLSSQDKNLDIDDYVEILTSPFEVSLNSKKIQNLITKQLQQVSQMSNFQKQFEDMANQINLYLKDLSSEIDLPIKVGEYSNENLIKNATFTVEQDNSFYENLVNYINCLLELTKVKLLVMVNFKNFITNENSEEFLKFLEYTNLKVLFVESIELQTAFATPQTIIIDNDLCEIIKNGNAT